MGWVTSTSEPSGDQVMPTGRCSVAAPRCVVPPLIGLIAGALPSM
jgi:hypothetical protein